MSPGIKKTFFIILAILSAALISYFSVAYGLVLPVAIIMISGIIILQISYFNNPRLTLFSLIFYCFTIGIFSREIGGMPYGTFIEVFIGFSYIYAFIKIPAENWARVKTDLFYLMLGWFSLSVLQVINPAGASVMGWMQEIRSAALYPILIIPLCYLYLNRLKDLNVFLKLIIIISLFAAVNGMKQLYFSPSPGEQRFLDEGGELTHILFGKLRVFSFYSDAGQFGASQAHLCVIALVLSFGPFKLWKKLLLLFAAGLFFYGMLISGTRGALFALIVGIFLAIGLSRKVKVMIIGGAIALSCLFILKYTTIGNNNYQIFRLRSALDPKDASLNVRMINQEILREYMSTRPFGGGLGVIGAGGALYNPDKFLSTVQPDSYWVKIWAMYGIVGFVIWISIMMYILGKCCGIVWRLEDPGLRIKAMALTSGYAGILICSYGNEVINTMPSSVVVYVSWVFVFVAPEFQKKLNDEKNKYK